MNDPIPQVYLDEADRLLAAEGSCIRHTDQAGRVLARTLQELGWKPPVDPMLVRAREIAMESSSAWATPDEYISGKRDHWAVVQAALIALREGMGE